MYFLSWSKPVPPLVRKKHFFIQHTLNHLVTERTVVSPTNADTSCHFFIKSLDYSDNSQCLKKCVYSNMGIKHVIKFTGVGYNVK